MPIPIRETVTTVFCPRINGATSIRQGLDANVKRLLDFMVERHQIWRRRNAGQPKPWTQWPVFLDFRFCNVYRELDGVAEWISEHWRTPNAADPDLWFAMAAARLVNEPGSLREIGWPIPFDRERFVKVLEDRKLCGLRCFNPAYRVGSAAGASTAEYVANIVLYPMWRDRELIRESMGGTLEAAHAALMACNGLGSFLAGQVVADLKYVEPLKHAPDWWTWAAPGPGSKRGLNRVLGRDKDAPWTDWEWLQELQKLHREMQPLLREAKMPKMHAQDMQNCLCEWDKAERFRLGEGKPKQRYPGRG